jgi:hypothetical protein
MQASDALSRSGEFVSIPTSMGRMAAAACSRIEESGREGGKAIEGDGMAKMLISKEARKKFANLHHTFKDVNHQLQTNYSQSQVSHPSPSQPA